MGDVIHPQSTVTETLKRARSVGLPDADIMPSFKFVGDIYHSHHVARFAVLLRHTGISFRNLVFGSAVFFFLWTSYYTFVFRHSLSLTVPTFVAPPPGPEEWRIRAQQVKNAFVHSYKGYEQHAWGIDELKPLTNRSQNKCVTRVSTRSFLADYLQLQWMGRVYNRLSRYDVYYGLA